MQRAQDRFVRVLLVLPGLTLGAVVPEAGNGELELARERLAGSVPELFEASGVPGLALALVDAEGVVWSRGLGARDASHGAPVREDTIFAAASLSKPVFAWAVLRLVDDGLLELDTPLVEYAPLPDLAHDPRHVLLTARHVLSHTTGLPNWRPRGGRLEFEADPGARWGYSGEGFCLLAGVVEHLTGADLEQVVRDLVFEPLGMESASFQRGDHAERLAAPHDEEGRTKPEPFDSVNAAASLHCTVGDYGRFLAAVLRGEALSPGLVAEMRRPQVQVSPGVSWGLGLGLEEQPQGPALWQWGHNDGFRAFAWASPARGWAFVFFTNGDTGMRLLPDLLRLATGAALHPAVEHLDY